MSNEFFWGVVAGMWLAIFTILFRRWVDNPNRWRWLTIRIKKDPQLGEWYAEWELPSVNGEEVWGGVHGAKTWIETLILALRG